MKKILFVFCLVISFIFTSCKDINVTRGDYMIVRLIRYPYNDNTVEYVVNGYTESGEYIEVENGHHTYCSGCGFEFEVEPHTIIDGLCDKCGFNDRTSKSKYTKY